MFIGPLTNSKKQVTSPKNSHIFLAAKFGGGSTKNLTERSFQYLYRLVCRFTEYICQSKMSNKTADGKI